MSEAYIFTNAGYDGNKVLDLSRTNNKTVLGSELNGGGNQKWKLEKHANNTFIFRSLDGDYLGEDIGRERPVGVSEYIAVGFRVEPSGDGAVHIGIFDENLLFDLGYDNIVRLKPATGSQAQKWRKLKVYV